MNKGAVFDICYTHPRVLAGIAHVLEADFKLSSLNYRAALPGQGHQALHTDWSEPVPAGQFRVCNSIWLLDDFTADNGPTRVVPGSHQRGALPKDEMPDPAAPHPHEVTLQAPAGTVVIFNSHLWHGGTLNRTAIAPTGAACVLLSPDRAPTGRPAAVRPRLKRARVCLPPPATCSTSAKCEHAALERPPRGTRRVVDMTQKIILSPVDYDREYIQVLSELGGDYVINGKAFPATGRSRRRVRLSAAERHHSMSPR